MLEKSIVEFLEQVTEEVYHPDKADLEGVLSSLSSARLLMSR